VHHVGFTVLKLLFYPLPPNSQNSTALEVSQASVICASGNSSVHVKASTEHWCNNKGRRKPRRKTCPSATLTTKNLTLSDLGSKRASVVIGWRLADWLQSRLDWVRTAQLIRFGSVTQTEQLGLCRGKVAVSSEQRTKHRNVLCEQNVYFLISIPVVHIVTTRL
jgi:hypothetical protein